VTPPRLFGIPARDAPVVAVLRRGPSDWCHLGRWDVGARPAYQPGAWLRARVYPQRCDLSPDGQWLCYFTLRGSADWRAGATYVAVSRLPWATALVAWGTCGTWTRGMQFVEPSGHQAGPPDEGDDAPLRRSLGLAFTRPAGFAVERRRGWTETDDSPPRAEHDMWDERRADRVTMQKRRPGGGPVLQVSGTFAAFRELDTIRYGEPVYRLVGDRGGELPGVQWADWSADGRLLVATVDGRLQVRRGAEVTWETDLAGLTPDPQPPPPQARRWWPD
jgi:hypothetical protein